MAKIEIIKELLRDAAADRSRAAAAEQQRVAAADAATKVHLNLSDNHLFY